MSGPIRPPLWITETDGNPSGRPINKIVVSNGTLTINGTTAEITTGGGGGSGTVTNVSSTDSFITITNPSTTPSITIQDATTSQDGILTSTDWNTFNNKTANAGTVTSVGSSQAFVSVASATTTPSITIGSASGAATGVLTATDWTTFNNKGSGTVTGITSIAPLAVDNSNPLIPSLAMPQSNTGQSGWLSSTDWNTFNNKGSGTVTGTGVANQISYWTAASVQAGSTGLTYDPSTGNLTVGGYVEVGTKVTTPTGTGLTLEPGSASSGSIAIADGANGQISITPNGTGKIKLDGVNLDNSAIATGYVLKATSATAAGWAAESGGGITFPIEADSGSSGAPSYSFSADTDTGIYLSGASNMAIAAGGQNYLYIGSLGSVQFNKKALFNAASAAAPNGFATDTNTGFFQPSADTIGFSTAGTEKLRFGSSGEILIGGTAAGAVNQVLTSGGSGAAVSWTTPSGGGSTYPVSIATAININDDTFILTSIPPYSRATTSASSQTIDTSVYYLPFIPPKNLTLTNLQIKINSAGTGNLSMALYDSDSAGNPNDILTDSTITIDASSTGYYTSTMASSQSLSGLTLYYIAVTMSANSCVLQSHTTYGTVSTGPVNGLNTYNRPLLYDSTTTTLPSSVTPSQLSTKYGFCPMIGGGF